MLLITLQAALSWFTITHQEIPPSEADKRLTRQLSEAGKLLEIAVLDHIIFTDGNYFSFADESLL